MGKYLAITGATLLVLSGIFLILSYVSPFGRQSVSQKSDKNASAKLYFKPDSITSSCLNSSYSIPIYLSTYNASANNAQIELLFNPDIIYNVLLTPSSNNFFGEKDSYDITLQEIREKFGRTSLAIQLHPDRTEARGDKPIAVFSFTINSPSSSMSSNITFLNKSTVSSVEKESSLLTETVPLTIYCNPQLRKTSTPSNQLN